jgi:hypothetical protein
MDETRELYTLKKGTTTLKEYFIPSNNRHRFEVKDREKTLYEGESFQHTKSLYKQISSK